MLAFGQCYGCVYEGERCPADSCHEMKKAVIDGESCCGKITIPALHYFFTHTSKKELFRLRSAAMEGAKNNQRYHNE